MMKEICHLLISTSALVNKRLKNYLEMENDLPFSNLFLVCLNMKLNYISVVMMFTHFNLFSLM